jgi:outer membrane protein insertion porin family
VRRIDIEGNTRTRDEVIRREFRQVESGWYAADKIERSKERLKRTQFFSDTNIETPAVPGTTDQVDLKVKVTERNTGSIMFGAGLSNQEGVIGSFNVTQANFLGTGDRVSAQVNTGRINRTYALSMTQPFFTPEGVALTYDLYRRDMNASRITFATYDTSSIGAGFRFSVPVTERNAFSYGLTYDNTEVENLNPDLAPIRFINYCKSVKGASNVTGCSMSSLTASVGWIEDSRDDILFPRKGGLRRANAEVSTPGLDIQMYKFTLQETVYKEITNDLTFMINGQAGYANSYGGKEFPFFKNFYVGGVNSLRGYRISAVGPVCRAGDAACGSATQGRDMFLGGTKQLVGSAELFMPVPFIKNNNQFRLSAFIDAGNVYEESEPIKLSSLRYSAGLGVMWISPFGPLKLIIAQPFNDKPTDRTEVFQFQMGQQF